MNTLRILCQPVLVCVLALAVSACGQTETYSSIEPGSHPARARSNLELPPDLVDTSNDALVSRQPDESGEPEEVLPETDSLEIQRNDSEGWLEVDAPAGQVWRKLESYWGSLNVDLEISDPKAGLMVTDWVRTGQNEDAGIMDKVLGSVVESPTSLDKYTIQLEKKGENRTRIQVAHEGMKKIQTQRSSVATNAEYEWVTTEEDPEKIKRALSSIVYGLETGAS